MGGYNRAHGYAVRCLEQFQARPPVTQEDKDDVVEGFVYSIIGILKLRESEEFRKIYRSYYAHRQDNYSTRMTKIERARNVAIELGKLCPSFPDALKKAEERSGRLKEAYHDYSFKDMYWEEVGIIELGVMTEQELTEEEVLPSITKPPAVPYSLSKMALIGNPYRYFKVIVPVLNHDIFNSFHPRSGLYWGVGFCIKKGKVNWIVDDVELGISWIDWNFTNGVRESAEPNEVNTLKKNIFQARTLNECKLWMMPQHKKRWEDFLEEQRENGVAI